MLDVPFTRSNSEKPSRNVRGEKITVTMVKMTKIFDVRCVSAASLIMAWVRFMS